MEAGTPSTDKTAFCCPHCNAYAAQIWHVLSSEEIKHERFGFHISLSEYIKSVLDNLDKGIEKPTSYSTPERARAFLFDNVYIYLSKKSASFGVDSLHVSKCSNCRNVAVWVGSEMVWPSARSGPAPNPDLPDDIKRDYEEARSIVHASPRGAAALLRLVIQKLCLTIGEEGKNLNEAIANMVRKGMDPNIQKALDVVRVIGNNAVHPGELASDEVDHQVIYMFQFVNEIAEKFISGPKRISQAYEKLPARSIEQIERRDRKPEQP
jgi:hypothetical protein